MSWTTRVRCPAAARKVFFCHCIQTTLRLTQIPINWVLGALSPEVKQLVHEADYSLPPSAEVKNAHSCISTIPYVSMVWCLLSTWYIFMVWYLVKHKDNLNFFFTFTNLWFKYFHTYMWFLSTKIPYLCTMTVHVHGLNVSWKRSREENWSTSNTRRYFRNKSVD